MLEHLITIIHTSCYILNNDLMVWTLTGYLNRLSVIALISCLLCIIILTIILPHLYIPVQFVSEAS